MDLLCEAIDAVWETGLVDGNMTVDSAILHRPAVIDFGLCQRIGFYQFIAQDSLLLT